MRRGSRPRGNGPGRPGALGVTLTAAAMLSFTGCLDDYVPDADDAPNDMSSPFNVPSFDFATRPLPDAAGKPPPDLSGKPVDGAQPDGGGGDNASADSVAPSRGPAGTVVEVFGSGFKAGDRLVLDDIDGTDLAILDLKPGRILAALPGVKPQIYLVHLQRGGNQLPADNLFFTLTPGAVHYIAPTGSDQADGSRGSPWRGIDVAAARMAPGDVTYLRGGTYANGDQINVTASGVAGSPLTFTAFPGEKPVMYLKDFKSPYGALDTIQLLGAYVTLDHIELTTQYKEGQVVWIGNTGHDNVVSNCNIHGARGSGLMISGNKNTILHNSIHDNGNGLHVQKDHGMYVAGGGNAIGYNTVYNNWANGIQVYNPNNQVTGANLLEGNYVYHNGWGLLGQAAQWETAGIIVGQGQPTTVLRNNKVCDNAKAGIALIDLIKNSQFTGNVTCYNGTVGLFMEYPGSPTIVSNHISYNDKGFAFVSQPVTVTSDDNTFFSTSGMPQFKLGTQNLAWAVFQTTSKNDAHSKIADPKFKKVPPGGFDPNAAATYDFSTPLNPELTSPP